MLEYGITIFSRVKKTFIMLTITSYIGLLIGALVFTLTIYLGLSKVAKLL